MKPSIISLFSLFLVLRASFQICPAQEAPVNIPPSPNAASLGQYLEIPIGLYSGTPGVQVPIWTLTGKEMSVPIGLSYHASGIKVEQNSTSVGLGWSLQAGGVVSRTVRGLPDEGAFGYIGEGVPANPELTDFFHQVQQGIADPQPDAFFFSFQGYSGKFVFDQNGEVHIHPKQDLDISYTIGSGGFLTFTIKTPDGTQYLFGGTDKREQTTTGTTTWSVPPGSTLGNPNHEIEQDSSINVSYTSWYLAEITSPSKTETFSFDYVHETYDYRGPKKGNFGFRANGDVEYRRISRTTTKISGKRLSEITCNSNGLSVVFEANKVRDDVRSIATAPEPKAYTKIIVKDIQGNPNRVFVLNTDYFRNPLLDVANSGIKPGEDFLFQRLKLTSVQEFSGDEIESKPAYVFTYDESIALPPKDAHTQDHWGYFNGDLSTQNDIDNYYSIYNMVPPYEGSVDDGPVFFYYYNIVDPSSLQTYDVVDPVFISKPGTNREPSYPGIQAGILQEIIYPTGGKTEFDFEQHEYGFVGNQDYEEIIYGTEEPLAEAENPWGSLPDATEEQIETYGPFTVGPKQTVQIQYEIQFAYEDVSDFNYDPTSCTLPNTPGCDGVSYTPNVLEFYKTSDPNTPILKVFYNYNAGYGEVLEQTPGTSTTYAITALVPSDSELDTDNFPNGVRATFEGSFNYELEAGETYELKAKRAKSYVNGINVQNNTSCWIQIAQTVQNDQVLQVIKEFDGGGLRVFKKTDSPLDGGVPIVEEYTYHMFNEFGNDQGTSSGSLVGLPAHFRSTYYYKEESSPIILDPLPTWSLLLGHIMPIFGWLADLPSGGVQVSGMSYLVFEMAADHPVPLGTTQGNPLGYRMVQISKPGNGSTINTYSSAYEYPDDLPYELNWLSWFQIGMAPGYPTDWGSYNVAQGVPRFYYPFLPTIDRDWQRGLLLEQREYNENQDLLRSLNQTYAFQELSSVPGYSTIYSGTQIKYLNLDQTANPWVEYTDNNFVSGWPKLVSSIHTQYAQVGTEKLVTSTFNAYEGLGHHQLTSSRTYNSDGRITESRTKFSSDYNPSLTLGSNSTLTIQDLLDENMIALPIEVQKWEGTNGNLKLLQASVTTFKDFNDSGSGEENIRPFETYIFESATPISLSEPKNGSGQYLSIIPDASLYIKRAEVDYQDQGQPIQFHRTHGVPVSYLWTNNQSVLSAEVSNASLGDIAYTSFEEFGNYSPGNWVLSIGSGGSGWSGATAKTGSQSLQLTASGSVSATVNTAGSYVLSYWANGPNPTTNVSSTLVQSSDPDPIGFVYYEYNVDLAAGATLTLTGTSSPINMDELRLFPTNARMSTICYDENLRIHSMTDLNNYSTYFLYDKLGRLVSAFDKDGNLLQTYDYHFKQ
ncbi:MAG: hypothetical protein AAF587_25250 [Bacteroidota bacterium]